MAESVAMFEIPNDAHYQVAERISQAVTGIGSGVAVASGIAGRMAIDHEIIWTIGVVCGSIAAIGGLLVTIYYKHQENKRQDKIYRMHEIEHKIRVSASNVEDGSGY